MTEQEIEAVREEILTAPTHTYPRIIDECSNRSGWYFSLLLVEWGPGRVEWGAFYPDSKHSDKCSRSKTGLPVSPIESCGCSRGYGWKTKSKGRWTREPERPKNEVYGCWKQPEIGAFGVYRDSVGKLKE